MSTQNGTTAKKMQVLTTTNYDRFSILTGNRIVNPLHLNRLKQSMEEDYLISPIIVNEKLEVIDGQHRLEAAKELGVPVYYIVCEGYGLPEIHRLNTNLKNWTMDDFMLGYITLGKKEYEFYKGFLDRYGFGHRESIVMLTGKQGGDGTKDFTQGKLKIRKYNEACIIADQIKKVEPYYEGWKRRGFVMAIVTLLKSGKFDVDEFIEKLKYQSTKMVDCLNVKQYTEVIEDIYNFKRRNGKVSFKYLEPKTTQP